ncbi:hypothetical protein [Streptomyces sp. RB17]|uniref:hypothetical protein n=1 Tax=Streptomyces sp. RB17 TaxID=2585197 RepID=UPI003A4C62AF
MAAGFGSGGGMFGWSGGGWGALLWRSGALAVLTVLAFIMLGDAVRDALDPKLR